MSVEYPFAGHPRRFTAVAMPNGVARFGVDGPLVMVVERASNGGHERTRYLSRDEAEEMADQLRGALRVFDLAPRLVEGLAPRACRAAYPFVHRSLAEVDAAVRQDEAA